MKRTIPMVAAAMLLFMAGAPATLALGPVDGEVAVLYWTGDAEFGGESVDVDGPGVRAELWFFKNFGVSAELFKMEADSEGDLDYTNLDIKWRPISPTENSFFALGAGWQQIDLEGAEASGLRLVAEGRVGLAGIVYGYGRVAYFPSLGDLKVGGETVATDVDGHEFDLGIAVEPMPFLSLWAGYRINNIDLNIGEGGSTSLETSGFYAGAGFHF